MEKCWFCGEEEATEKIRDPNKEQDDPLTTPLVGVCWDCKKYIEWTKLHMIASVLGMLLKPFDE